MQLCKIVVNKRGTEVCRNFKSWRFNDLANLQRNKLHRARSKRPILGNCKDTSIVSIVKKMKDYQKVGSYVLYCISGCTSELFSKKIQCMQLRQATAYKEKNGTRKNARKQELNERSSLYF